ncbi:MAG: hypothetical protein WCA15_07735 [Candidatus Acidiferrales bacterium]
MNQAVFVESPEVHGIELERAYRDFEEFRDMFGALQRFAKIEFIYHGEKGGDDRPDRRLAFDRLGYERSVEGDVVVM